MWRLDTLAIAFVSISIALTYNDAKSNNPLAPLDHLIKHDSLNFSRIPSDTRA
jgi:hypothetical protein